MIMVSSCKKDKESPEDNQNELQFSLSQTDFFPYETIEINYSGTLNTETPEFRIGDEVLFASKQNGDLLVLLCPDILSGEYNLTFQGELVAEIRIKEDDFLAENPESIIKEWNDSLIVAVQNGVPTPYQTTIQEMSATLTSELKLLSLPEQKQMVRLLYRQGMLDPDYFHIGSMNLSDSFIQLKSEKNIDNWYSSFASRFTENKVKSIISFAVAGGLFLTPVPDPFTKIGSLVAALSGVYHLNKSLNLLDQLGNVIGKVGSIEVNNKKAPSVEFRKDIPTQFNLKATLTNLTSADEARGIFPSFFADLKELNAARSLFISGMNKVIEWFNGKIEAPSQDPLLLTSSLKSKEMVLDHDAYELKSVSNNQINLVKVSGGSSLTMRASSDQISEDTEFNFELSYNQPTLNHAVYSTIEATYSVQDIRIHMKEVSGNYQAGHGGQPLSEKLKVMVTDDDNKPISGITVQWKLISHSGTVTPTSVTNSSGIAEASWTIEDVCDYPDQRVMAEIVEQDGYITKPNSNTFTFRARKGFITLHISGNLIGNYPANGSINISTENGFNQTFTLNDLSNPSFIDYDISIPSLKSGESIQGSITYSGNRPLFINLLSGCTSIRIKAKGLSGLGDWNFYAISESDGNSATKEFEIMRW